MKRQGSAGTMGPTMSAKTSYRSSRNGDVAFSWVKHEDLAPGCINDYIMAEKPSTTRTSVHRQSAVRVTQHDIFHQPILTEVRTSNRTLTSESLIDSFKRGLPVLVYGEEEKFEPRILKVDEDLTLMFVVHIGDQVEMETRSEKNMREPGVIDLRHMTELFTGDTAMRVCNQFAIKDERLTEETAFVINHTKHTFRAELMKSERRHHAVRNEEQDDDGGATATLLGAKAHSKLLFVIAAQNIQLQRTLRECVDRMRRATTKRHNMDYLTDARSETMLLGISLQDEQQVFRNSGDIDLMLRLVSLTHDEDEEEIHASVKLCSNAPKAGVKKAKGDGTTTQDLSIEVPLHQKVPVLKSIAQLIVTLIDKGLSSCDAMRVELSVLEAAAFRLWATTMLPEIFPGSTQTIYQVFRTATAALPPKLEQGQAIMPEHLKRETVERSAEHSKLLTKRAKDSEESLYYEAGLRATVIAMSHFLHLEQQGEALAHLYETEIKARAKAKPTSRNPNRQKTHGTPTTLGSGALNATATELRDVAAVGAARSR